MSWSLTRTVEKPEELDGLAAALTKPAEATEQIGAAITAAKAIIASGVVGAGKRYGVTLSGHANPGHEPATGWANDCITVSVTQV